MYTNELFFGLGPTLTQEQKQYIRAIKTKQIVFCNAKAGTGKTTIAVAMAKLLNQPLYYCFSPVEEATMGFRPGTEEEKMHSYVGPLIDALKKIGEMPEKVMYSEKIAPEHIKNQTVWVYPKTHVFMRGINLYGSTLIIDEAQNFTKEELRKVLTRVHDDCKVIVIGHDGQCDIDPVDSGFKFYLEHFRNEPYCEVIELTKNFRGKLAQHADTI